MLSWADNNNKQNAGVKISKQTQYELFPLMVVCILNSLKLRIDKDAFRTWCMVQNLGAKPFHPLIDYQFLN